MTACLPFNFILFVLTMILRREKAGYQFNEDEGLTLETSAFQIFHGGNSTFINSFDKTKFLLCLSI